MRSITPERINISFRSLRRLTERGVDIAEKYRTAGPAFEAMAARYVGLAEAFHVLYDGARDANTSAKLRAAREKVDELDRLLQRWLLVVGKEVPLDASRTSYGSVAEDVITVAKYVYASSEAFASTAQAPPPYLPALLQTLGEALTTTSQEWEQTRELLRAHQEEKQQLREAASEAYEALKMLRKLVRITLGTRHVDFRALRSIRKGTSSSNEEGLDEAGEAVEVAEGSSASVVVSADAEKPATAGAAKEPNAASEVLDAFEGDDEVSGVFDAMAEQETSESVAKAARSAGGAGASEVLTRRAAQASGEGAEARNESAGPMEEVQARVG